jgi:hypothetical protein
VRSAMPVNHPDEIGSSPEFDSDVEGGKILDALCEILEADPLIDELGLIMADKIRGPSPSGSGTDGIIDDETGGVLILPIPPSMSHPSLIPSPARC